ncbi:MAG: tRNA lysidine(34) synthetase TilS [Chloroflexi bacterium]|nr:tRNA lysidine(34) synthetase TilS [Chloroflexota bacterium]MCI0579490.1 tRNA lysidine(34) synthetase TilS [Chloroflexota bacterium]MCI0650193.1 tRNA lysidine(34) synthetase TilS [Chloroflexota bacterium]MCI0729496.1 tRNA lysidine(34) synthetase TilS [Chloroflexota bacterium]
MSLVRWVQEFLANWPAQEDGRHRPGAADTVVVAVSGGPDSLALLHVLARQGIHPADKLVVAHLDHGLRPSATAEATFVAKTAAAWGVACVVEREDVVALARDQGLSLEEAGRQARYAFLARVAAQRGAAAVATGHHADDQAETVLMHFLRGSSLAGLRGMLPVGPLPGAPHLTLFRPFLEAPREEILAYCQEHDLAPVEDASNMDTTFFRNRLRHELLPALAGYNPQIRERLQHLAAVAAGDVELLEALLRQAWTKVLREEGADWLRLDRARWLALPLALRRSTLRHAVWRLRPALRDVGFVTVEQARQMAETGQVGGQSTLPAGLALVVGYDDLTLSAMAGAAPLPDLPQLPDEKPQPLAVPGRVALVGGWQLAATFLERVELAEIQANQDPWIAFVDVPDPAGLVIRPRRPGERFRPLGMGGQSARVVEVMINRKIRAGLRPLWPVVANDQHLIWLVGHHIDERGRVTEGSRQVVKLHVERVT